jgi:hypothetical protein
MGIPLPILAGSYDPAKILASAKLVNNLVETPPGSAETMAHETGT